MNPDVETKAKNLPVIKPLCKLKHNGKMRDINSEENGRLANSINECIDEMIVYKPYAFFMQSLRAKISNYRGALRAYAQKMVEKYDSYKCITDCGELMIYSVPSLSTRIELVNEALQELELSNIDETIHKTDPKQRAVVVVNTDALKINPIVMCSQNSIIDDFYGFEKTVKCKSTENANDDRFLAAALMWMKTNIDYHKRYLAAYNKAKQIFVSGSRDESFPRLYTYQGCVFIWKDILETSSLYSRVAAFLLLTDRQQYDRLHATLAKIRSDRKETRPMVSLDGFDYEQGEDSDP
jgi:hypothetical protein